jgi:hypothetical protein
MVQYYGIATTTIFFYEYFVMLPDEVTYGRDAQRSFAIVETDAACTDPVRMVFKQNLGYVHFSYKTKII